MVFALAAIVAGVSVVLARELSRPARWVLHRGRACYVVITRPDSSAARPPDLVQRRITASRPNELWVVDFTYVPTWSGMGFTAFVADAFDGGQSSIRVAVLPMSGLYSRAYISTDEAALCPVWRIISWCVAPSRNARVTKPALRECAP